MLSVFCLVFCLTRTRSGFKVNEFSIFHESATVHLDHENSKFSKTFAQNATEPKLPKGTQVFPNFQRLHRPCKSTQAAVRGMHADMQWCSS